jgi:hypothetical protein
MTASCSGTRHISLEPLETGPETAAVPFAAR